MLDLTKPVQTRDGRKVRILCTDRAHESYPIVALIAQPHNGVECFTAFTKDGLSFVGRVMDEDLVNVPQRHKHADVIIAWANGAQIQFYSKSIEDWEDISRPLWEALTQYRVKPA